MRVLALRESLVEELVSNHIARAWLDYLDDVIPRGASAIQIQECKRAFYSGGWLVLALVMELGKDEFDEDFGVVTLESMKVEFETFTAARGKTE